MTQFAPATASFRQYQPPASLSRHSYHPSAAVSSASPYSYEYDAPAPVSYRRHAEESTQKHSLSASVAHSSAAASASSSSSFSPLSLCSSVSSVASSSSGASSSSSAYSSPTDTFDLEEMGEDSHHHPYFHQQHSQLHRHSGKQPAPLSHPQQLPVKTSRPHHSPQLIHQHPHPLADGMMYYPAPAGPSPPMHQYGRSHSPPPPAMSISIPTSNGGWKEASNGIVRRKDPQMPPQAHPMLEVPTYLPAPLQPIVASAAEVLGEGKSLAGKKKGRSLRRCMDREKHSKAEQKRRGEMKALFDQLQDISQCVYKDRIHILTLAIQTIQRQQDTIVQLQSQQGKNGRSRAVKKEESQHSTDSNGAHVDSSEYSSPLSSLESVGSKRAAVVAELDGAADPVVKQEQDVVLASSPKKQRTSPHPRTVVDLSIDNPFVSSSPSIEASTVSAMSTSYVGVKPLLQPSFSSSSLSTFVCPSSADSHSHFPYLVDEQPHGPYITQPAQQHALDEATSKPAQQQPPHGLSHSTPPGMSPVFSFTAHPQHWWPLPVEANKH